MLGRYATGAPALLVACLLIGAISPLRALANSTTTTTTSTTTLFPPRPDFEIYEPRTTNDCQNTVPDSALEGTYFEDLPAGGTILYLGDSVSSQGRDNRLHWMIVAKAINASIDKYCGEDVDGNNKGVTVCKHGSGGSKPYIENDLDFVPEIDSVNADWLVVQDAGKVTSLGIVTAPIYAYPDTAASTQLFGDFLANRIDDVLAHADDPLLFMISTPPLEDTSTNAAAAGNCRDYARGCNWSAQNAALREGVADVASDARNVLPSGLKRVSVVAGSEAGCRVLADPPGNYDFTGDGVHPNTPGMLHVFYALLVLQHWFGESGIPGPVLNAIANDGELHSDASLANIQDFLARMGTPEAPVDYSQCTFVPDCSQLGQNLEALDCVNYCRADDDHDGVLDHACRLPFFHGVGACCSEEAPAEPGPDSRCVDHVTADYCQSAYQSMSFDDDATCSKSCCGGSGDPIPAAPVCATCGDGVDASTYAHEECDDGNGATGDCCTPDCRSECPGNDGCMQCDTATGECGAVQVADDVPCEAGDLCLSGDKCVAGVCVAGSVAVSCESGIECQVSDCSSFFGCEDQTSDAEDGDACYDSNICNGLVDRCQAGECAVNVGPDPCQNPNHPDCGGTCAPPAGGNFGECSRKGLGCDTGDPCTAGTCDGMGFCVADPANEGGGCASDGVSCTNDVCDDSGNCTHDPVHVACGDGNPCTDDICDVAIGGCRYVNNTAPCDDGLFCTTSSVCSDGSCVGTGNPCAGGDACNDECSNDPAATSCTETGTPCDDLDLCNGPDLCDSGSCSVHTGTDPCQNEQCRSCDPDTGQCAPFPSDCTTSADCHDDAPCSMGACWNMCDDGDFCTATDVCIAGSCAGMMSPCPGPIDDCNVCNGSAESCFADEGTTCSDDDRCTIPDESSEECDGLGTCGDRVCPACPGFGVVGCVDLVAGRGRKSFRLSSRGEPDERSRNRLVARSAFGPASDIQDLVTQDGEVTSKGVAFCLYDLTAAGGTGSVVWHSGIYESVRISDDETICSTDLGNGNTENQECWTKGQKNSKGTLQYKAEDGATGNQTGVSFFSTKMDPDKAKTLFKARVRGENAELPTTLQELGAVAGGPDLDDEVGITMGFQIISGESGGIGQQGATNCWEFEFEGGAERDAADNRLSVRSGRRPE